MRVALTQTGDHAPWKKGELVTLEIVQDRNDAGAYECETLETYPPDIKQRHADELNRIVNVHEGVVQAMTFAHEQIVQELQARVPKEDIPGESS